MDINEVNAMSESDCIARFGNIVEKYQKCAISLCKSRPYHDKQSFQKAASNYLDKLNTSDAEDVLKAHPDLVGQVVNENILTVESQAEQKGAGLRDISSDENAELARLNTEYKNKFNFPFIICARENKFDSILKGLRERLGNEKEQEKINALGEVKKITHHRISDLIL